jgi:hypothetical protein
MVSALTATGADLAKDGRISSPVLDASKKNQLERYKRQSFNNSR